MRTSRTGWMHVMAAIGVMAISGCSSNANEVATTAGATVSVDGRTPPVKPAIPQDFGSWKAAFRARALSAGITPATFDRAFSGVRVNDEVIELDNRQPEFSRPIWEYLDSAVSDRRIATGRDKARTMSTTLRGIQDRYGVDYPVIVAIWGLESGYGANFGNIPVIESMATLAFDGRRKAFAEEQLIAALRILQAGDITPSRMVGSWAGAMGHTQFIPTSFLSYAVDYTGDGKRDIWAADAADALASTGNYLSRFGWTLGEPAIVEVRLPDGFDYASADDKIRKSTAEWEALEVAGVTKRMPASPDVSILLPAGARGPAFAAYPNFRVIKRYNNATSYALAVAHLAERIQGGDAFEGSWPRDDRTLSRTEKQELQQRLTELGFDTQGVDGIIGPNSRKAVRMFQQRSGLVPDGYVSAALLTAVRKAGS